MVIELQNEERVTEKLKKQLAFAVRNIQWSYAIFWSISHRQSGVLEWGEGYYNGDIKTRKTLQSVELNADQMGLQRSEQLRELYESLSAGESSPIARRPSASLSPEDLSDAEWYYLVCMSFVFNLGQGLPGRALANGQPIWLYNAQSADSKMFSRSLLAKSASIQTVVCFPFLGGVIELGVSDLVLEDYTLIQNFKMLILDISNRGASNTRNDRVLAGEQDLNFSSPSKSSEEELEPDQQAKDSLIMVEGINGAASQLRHWQQTDDELSNCLHNNSMESSDCISQNLIEPELINKRKNVPQHVLSEDLHYQSIIATLFKDSNKLLLGPHFKNLNRKSSFVRWKRVGFRKQISRGGASQRLVKKILFDVPQMHVRREEAEADEIGDNHAVSEKKRRERLNEKFSVLKTLVPSISKDDKVSILDDAIEYLKELEKRVEDLETCRATNDLETKAKRKSHDASEGTSDNYEKMPLINKRKVRDVDEVVTELSSSENIAVRVTNRDIVIEAKCLWRDGVLFEIMDALADLHIDSHSVQSSTVDGVISLTIKSTIKASMAISAKMIKQSLKRVIRSR